MSIFERVQQERNSLRKVSTLIPEYKILTLLLGEIDTKLKRDGGEPTDEICITIIKKLIKSNEETMKRQDPPSLILGFENQTLGSFLPEQLSPEKIRTVLGTVGFSNGAEAFRYLDRNFSGQYDRRVAFQVISSILEEK